MRIAAIPIATADLGSDGGVIDGRARAHWRDGACFPAAGDRSALFIIYYLVRRSAQIDLHVSPKPCFSAVPPLVGVNLVAWRAQQIALY